MRDDWQQIFRNSDKQDPSCLESSLVRQPETPQRVDLMLKYVNVDRTESNSTSSCPGEERKHNRGTSFHFFESFDNQKQPETAQKDDLRLRDVNQDINESKSSSNCEGKSVKSGPEVGWT